MKIRLVIERRYAEAFQGGGIPEPFTQPIRALFGKGELPAVYIEVVPDGEGGLQLRGSAKPSALPVE